MQYIQNLDLTGPFCHSWQHSVDNFKDAFPVGFLCVDAKGWGEEEGCQSCFHGLAHLLNLTYLRYPIWLEYDLIKIWKSKENLNILAQITVSLL